MGGPVGPVVGPADRRVVSGWVVDRWQQCSQHPPFVAAAAFAIAGFLAAIVTRPVFFLMGIGIGR